MTRTERCLRSQAGYSGLEMLLVVGILGIASAIALLQIGNVQPSLKGDGAMRTVIAQLNTARELSITQRRRIQVTFTGGNTINLIRQNVPVASGTTVLASVPLEGGLQFSLTPGLPDTPDAFGNGAAVSFGTATAVSFNSDGTFINDNSGTPINGTVFLTMPNQANQANRSSRAVTILGATGRVRGYKWDGSKWVRA